MILRPKCNLHITGIDPYLFYMAMVQALCPDRVTNYEDTKILLYPDRKSSQLESVFNTVGTAIFDVALNDLAKDAYQTFLVKSAASTTTVSSPLSQPQVLSSSLDSDEPPSKKQKLSPPHRIVDGKQVLSPPQDLNGLTKAMEMILYEKKLPRYLPLTKMFVKGKMLIQLDEHNRMERVDQISEI